MHLRHASEMVPASASSWEDGIRSEIYQIGNRDSWVCLFDIMGMVQLRYGLEVKDGFLLIRNIPWSSRDRIERVENAALNGMELKVWPSACDLQLPGLFATAAEKERDAAFQGMGFLYPLITSSHASMDNVFDEHRKLFGFAPRQSAGDEWRWVDGTIESRLYGSVFNKKQPGYPEGEKGFGLMGCVEDLSVQMQFEDTGLRTSIRWKARCE